MKKRKKLAIIIGIIILLFVITVLAVNYVKYSNCSGANASVKPGCAAWLAEQAKNATKPLLRINFGSRYIDIG